MIQQLLGPGKALRSLRKTALLLAAVLDGVSPERAVALRDGDDGWSVRLIVCHLLDYEADVRGRVAAMLEREMPVFVLTSNADLAARHVGETRALPALLADLGARRADLIATLEGLSDEQWMRRGLHPEQGPATVLEVAVNAALHDIDHLEQLVRCLAPGR
jgi:hypothetical protein